MIPIANPRDIFMHIPAMVMSATFGLIGGVVLAGIIGFNWLGWVTNDTVERTARLRAEAAVISALSPICVQKFREEAGVDERLIKLKRDSAWQQTNFISRGGWATLPGRSKPDLDVARACAAALVGAKT
ncbi:hypothetical protein [Methylocella sp. CPCC 101449]|uniref:hypothetical protein n=1 Tax=Methylocella sp. CPCC 101449 TaxID=2987531 RepID=UPI00288F86BA|nr:hypothetical protein [Methylocella sp. CPCC 101449]MDT2021261.1 hypothetical protein [Methylocella sp. CPCC 101449]